MRRSLLLHFGLMTRPTPHPSPLLPSALFLLRPDAPATRPPRPHFCLLPSALCLLMTRNLACTCLVSLNVPKSAQGELVKKTTLFVMAFVLAGSLAMAQQKAAPAATAPAAAAP